MYINILIGFSCLFCVTAHDYQQDGKNHLAECPTCRKDLPPECFVSSELEPCERVPWEYRKVVWYLDPITATCTRFTNTYKYNICRVTGIFLNANDCKKTCGFNKKIESHPCIPHRWNLPCQPSDWDQSTLTIATWFFIESENRCQKRFCGTAAYNRVNGFDSEIDCIESCINTTTERMTTKTMTTKKLKVVTKKPRMTTEVPKTTTEMPRTTTEVPRTTTKTSTTTTKIPRIKKSTTNFPSRTYQEECMKPDSLSPCGQHVAVYYYDEDTENCEIGEIGGCHYANSYQSKEKCEERCGREIQALRMPAVIPTSGSLWIYMAIGAGLLISIIFVGATVAYCFCTKQKNIEDVSVENAQELSDIYSYVQVPVVPLYEARRMISENKRFEENSFIPNIIPKEEDIYDYVTPRRYRHNPGQDAYVNNRQS